MKQSISNLRSSSLGLSRVALVFLAIVGTAGAQSIIYVDDDGPGDNFPGFSDPLNQLFSDDMEDGTALHPYDDLWKAVDAASPGDTVVVLPSNVVGAYFLPFTLDVQGKDIAIRSQGGAAVTTIDGTSMPGSAGVSFDQGEPSSTVFEGFTLRNFDRGSGGSDAGGAIEILNSSPTIRDCLFEQNHAYVGAALYTSNSNSLVEDCTFNANDVVHQGGAVYTNLGRPTFSRCTFDANTANYGGAFLSRTNSASAVTVKDSLFTNNVSMVGYAGGLAKFDTGTLTVTRSRFIGNVATVQGGGAYISGGGLVSDCTFNSNTSLANQGGGISTNSSGTHRVHGSTFHANLGGGIHETGAVFTTLANCIVWNNSGYEIAANVSVSYCNVMGGYAGTNLDTDPMFMDADGPDNMVGTLDDDLSLFQASPCIDAGNTAVLLAGYPKDMNGRPRAVNRAATPDTGFALVGLTTDMGAFEYQVGSTLQRFRR